jgi:hypothetical protein
MKNLIIALIPIFISNFSYGQKSLTFDEAKQQGLSMSHLDSIYASGIHSDTTLAVFNNNEDEYISSYRQLLQDLGQYLKINNFLWENQTKGFNRIYFDKTGKIDYFLYLFRPNQLTKKEEKRFGELLEEFIQEYRFLLTADKKFAQCSPVTYSTTK